MSKFTAEQITYPLRLADTGTLVVDVYRHLGVSEGFQHLEEEIRRFRG